jgi:HlyD family secretion protein
VTSTTKQEAVRQVIAGGRGWGRWRKLLWGVALVLVVGMVWRVVLQRRAAERPRYLTEPITTGDLTVTVSATGTLEGMNTVEVGSEVSGKVLRVLVDWNDTVTPGQLLAEIDPEQLHAAVDEARAQLAAALASIKTAQATLHEAKQAEARAVEQGKLGLVSVRDQESARAAALRAEASLESSRANALLARAQLTSAESRLTKTKIIAPIGGVVMARWVQPGQTLAAGFQTPVLFKLAEDLGKLDLHVDIDEADVGRVREGMEATFSVDAYPERTFPSRVLSVRVEPTVSQNVVTYEAVLAVDNRDRALRPGMTATATITHLRLTAVKRVPNAALRFTPPGASPTPKTIYTPVGEGLIPLAVAPGPSDGRFTQLLGDSPSVGLPAVVDVLRR